MASSQVCPKDGLEASVPSSSSASKSSKSSHAKSTSAPPAAKKKAATSKVTPSLPLADTETVLGSFCPDLGDQLVSLLAESLRSLYEENADEFDNANVCLELEGRVGTIIDTDTGERLRLPLDSEAIVNAPGPHDNCVRWRFEPGLQKQQFDDLKERIRTAVGLSSGSDLQPQGVTSSSSKSSGSKASGPLKFACLNVCTSDEFVPHPDYDKPIRVSYPVCPDTQDAGHPPLKKARQDEIAVTPVSEDVPREILRKRNLFSWSVYTGRDKEEDDGGGSLDWCGKKCIDYRVAFNLEYKMNHLAKSYTKRKDSPHYLGGLPRHVVTRRDRKRQSFVSEMFQIDTTEVQTVGGSSSGSKTNAIATFEPVYELEVELNEDVLANQLNLFTHHKENSLYVLCSNFLNVMRDCCAFLNANTATTSIDLDPEILNQDASNTTAHTPSASSFLRLADLRRSAAKAEEVEKYLKYVCPRCPLIGDYLFRDTAEAQRRKRSKQALTDSENAEKPKAAAKPAYTDHGNHELTGAWTLQKVIKEIIEKKGGSGLLPVWMERFDT
eukprot:GHVQ01009105.1.p1 GENE.GHVQ01009105.1~~GHVQ01009105.1.p1  ORF type:complete len:553 (-),score=78.44 GHVQ01009105.1:3338-4996(-)